MASRIKQIDYGKLLPGVDKWSWNPKIDLLAVTTKDALAVLYGHEFRILWKAVSLDGSMPIQPAWRMDGKMVAICYESGRFCLFNCTSAKPVHCHQKAGHIYFCIWHRQLYQTDAIDYKSTCILNSHDRSIDSGYLDIFLLCYKSEHDIYLELLAAGVQTLFRVRLNDDNIINSCINGCLAIQEVEPLLGVLPEEAEITIWAGCQIYKVHFPLDWDALCHCLNSIIKLNWNLEEIQWIDWCREVWDKLGTLQSLQKRLEDLATLIGHVEMKDQLISLLATGTTRNQNVINFLNTAYEDHTIRTSSAILMLNNASENLNDRLCRLLLNLEMKYKCAAEIIGIAEFYPYLKPLYDQVVIIKKTILEMCVLTVKVCEKIQEHVKEFMPFFKWLLLIILLFNTSSENNSPSIPAELKMLSCEDIDQVEFYIQTKFNEYNFRIDLISPYFVRTNSEDGLSLGTLWDELNGQIDALFNIAICESVKESFEQSELDFNDTVLDVLYTSNQLITVDKHNEGVIIHRQFDNGIKQTLIPLKRINFINYKVVAAKICDRSGNIICLILHANDQYSIDQDPAKLVVIRQQNSEHNDNEQDYSGCYIFSESVDRNSSILITSKDKSSVMLMNSNKTEAKILNINPYA